MRNKVFAISIALYLLESLYKEKKTEWKRIAIKGIKILKDAGVDPLESQDYIAKLWLSNLSKFLYKQNTLIFEFFLY